MLEIKDITKSYGSDVNKVEALRGVSLMFGESGLVSICGASGCGKTTLLNIIGGLDRYTTGDLIINGVSTKDYKDSDWDRYRNNHIGFVFQNYYLIPQLSVLENVMLAMDIGGMSREEQKKNALIALDKVGLKNQCKKKPRQLSGGQAQRVAIARAICNKPSVILADEPTGALDSENSEQIAKLLKELSKESLVIIVTHNEVIAESYSDRIVRLQDGAVISDEVICEKPVTASEKKKPTAKHTMHFFAAFLLSLKNLYYKKGRTLLTSFAGCIGVIAISVILAFNAGFSAYAESFQKEQLGKYPIQVTKQKSSLTSIERILAKVDDSDYSTLDTNTIIDILTEEANDKDSYSEEEIIYIRKVITGLVANFDSLGKENDTTYLASYIQDHKDELAKTGAVKFDYDISLNVYTEKDGDYTQISPFSSRVIDSLNSQEISLISKLVFGTTLPDKERNDIINAFSSTNFWDSLVDDMDILNSQYDLLAGHWPGQTEEDNVFEIVLVVDEYNQITDSALYALGELEIMDLVQGILSNSGDSIDKFLSFVTDSEYQTVGLGALFQDVPDIRTEWTFDDFLYSESGREFNLLVNTDYYEKTADGQYRYSDDIKTLIEEKGISLRIGGIVRQKTEVTSGCINGVIGYPQSLVEHIVNTISSSEMVLDQIENYNEYIRLISTEEYSAYNTLAGNISSGKRDLDTEPLTADEQALYDRCNAYAIQNVIEGAAPLDLLTYDSQMQKLGVKNLSSPENIFFYPSTIENAKKVVAFLDSYNAETKGAFERGETTVDNSVEYEDRLSDIMADLNGMINTITYILIAITCLAVFVSAIMVGVIMYISVHDRTKEIGILRSLGARSFDVLTVFSTETMLLGLFSGVIGVCIGHIISYPLNTFLYQKLYIANLITPLWWHALALVGLSVLLNCISGLIPAIMAAKKDPVNALRTE